VFTAESESLFATHHAFSILSTMSVSNASHDTAHTASPALIGSSSKSDAHGGVNPTPTAATASSGQGPTEHVFFTSWNYMLGSGEYPFYPKGDLRFQDPRQGEAFEEFKASEPNFAREMKEMEDKGWVTRVITRGYVSWHTGDVELEVTHVDYHLPGPIASTTLEELQENLGRGRPSPLWRMMEEERLPSLNEWASEAEATTQAAPTPSGTRESAVESIGPVAFDVKKYLAEGASAVSHAVKTVRDVTEGLPRSAEKGRVVVDFQAQTARAFEKLDAFRAQLHRDLTSRLEAIEMSPTGSGPGIISRAEAERFMQDTMLAEACRLHPALAAEKKYYEGKGYTATIECERTSGGLLKILGLRYDPGKLTTAQSINSPVESAYSPWTRWVNASSSLHLSN